MKLVTGTEMRAIEASVFAAGETASALMEVAGREVALAIQGHLGSARARRVVVLVGPGNNGGDGLVAARHLHDAGAEVVVYLLAPRHPDDSVLLEVRSRDLEVISPSDGTRLDSFAESVERADAIIDAVLGAGRRRPLEGVIADALALLGRRRSPLFAIDLPSGVDPDTGAADPQAARADVTLSLGFAKLGLYSWPGSSYAGKVNVLDIGFAATIADEIKTVLLTSDWAREQLPERSGQSNKGTFGRVLIVAGSTNYTGAAVLAALGALRSGAGLVTLAGIAQVRAAVAAQLPEVTYLPLPESDGTVAIDSGDVVVGSLASYDVLLIGPGLGQSANAQTLVSGVLSDPAAGSIATVVDADALNCLAKVSGWSALLNQGAILTPHPGEFARLCRLTISEVQADRLALARSRAQEWRQTVVLKGAHTVIAEPEGQALVSSSANAGLATAGTGDVLAGTIAGLAAQGVKPFGAAALGAFLHSSAADLYQNEYGASGLLASELGAGIARVAATLRK